MERGAQGARQQDQGAAHFPFPFLNVAVTEVADFTLTTQVGLDPEQTPPLQPRKVELFLDGVAVSVTTSPVQNGSAQSRPQLIPEGLLVTVPGPDFVTVTG